jgi:hypothetical protein
MPKLLQVESALNKNREAKALAEIFFDFVFNAFTIQKALFK